MSNRHLYDIAENFAFDASATDIKPLGEGFINDSYIVTTAKSRYILQRKNHIVFPDIEAMMDNIWRVTAHLKA
ncbi:MAG: aminoglycoside phosphotransferase family protein, partial [Alistipes sp.]|nr:aminoglycoside phosphotransferase family protein [Alistipes sp.]